jgi:hypothetical protein
MVRQNGMRSAHRDVFCLGRCSLSDSVCVLKLVESHSVSSAMCQDLEDHIRVRRGCCPSVILPFRSVTSLTLFVVSCCTGLLKMCSRRVASLVKTHARRRLVARLPHDARAMRRPAFHLVVPQSFARDTHLYVVPPPHHIHKATRHTTTHSVQPLLFYCTHAPHIPHAPHAPQSFQPHWCASPASDRT